MVPARPVLPFALQEVVVVLWLYLYCLPNIVKSPLDHVLLHEQVGPIFQINMVVGIHIYGIVVALNGRTHMAQLNFSKGLVVEEEVVVRVDGDGLIVHFDGLLEFLEAETDVAIVAQENLITRFYFYRNFVVLLSLLNIVRRKICVSSVVKVAASLIQVDCLRVGRNSLPVISYRFVGVPEDEVKF